jgi:hypothetical protein
MHNYASIIRNHQDEFAAHPEYRILLDGKRSPRGICTGQPEVRAFAVENALAYFAKNPEADMFSMERGDGSTSCECELCKAIGSESNRVFGFANEVAKAVAEKYPGKMIGLYAYNTHDLPPEFPLEPNVHVQVARLFITSKTPFLDLLNQWHKKTSNLGVREYFSTFQHGQDRFREYDISGPTANLARLEHDISAYVQDGALSVSSESSIAWGAHGRGNFLAAKLLWNPQVDVKAVLADFYDRAFGPAAAPMQKYFERADGGNQTIDPAFYLALIQDLKDASDLAKDRPDVMARLDQLKQFMYYNLLSYRYRIEKPNRSPILLELYRHQFRTRYSYMTHWEALRQLMRQNKQIDQSWILPGWTVFAKAKKEGKPLPADPPWLDWTPYTHEETEAKFLEAEEYFQNQQPPMS